MNGVCNVGAPSIPGFENINRYWDTDNLTVAAKLLPGQFYVTNQNEMITTVLGSCVSACVRDVVSGIGGMNHFMLPQMSKVFFESQDDNVIGSATRYGNFAMESLINTILSHGGKRNNLEVKLFGGGKIIATLGSIGDRNIQFILEYVEIERLKLVAYDLGDVYPRKVNFYPMSGRVRLKKIKELQNQTIVSRDVTYGRRITQAPVEGSVELF
jgi:chemotaxis protein CheD